MKTIVLIMSCLAGLVVLLLCTVGSFAICPNASICIASHANDTGCAKYDTVNVFTPLSKTEVPVCESVRIYLSSGTHILSANLTFNYYVEDTEIYGSPTGEPSIILCKDEVQLE